MKYQAHVADVSVILLMVMMERAVGGVMVYPTGDGETVTTDVRRRDRAFCRHSGDGVFSTCAGGAAAAPSPRCHARRLLARSLSRKIVSLPWLTMKGVPVSR